MRVILVRRRAATRPRPSTLGIVLRRLVLEQHLQPQRLFAPWLFPVLAGWLLVHHVFLATVVTVRDIPWVLEAPTTTAWLLGALAALWMVWALLVQLGRVDEHCGTGFILCGFGVWVIQWVETMAMLLVELPPHYLSPAQFGETRAALCIHAGYVAYAVGLGLVVGGMVSRWHAPARRSA